MRELVSRWGNVLNTVLLLSRTMGSGHLAQLDLLSRAQSWWRRAQLGRVRGAGLELWNAAQSLNTISHRINRSNRFIASTGTTISLSYYQLCFNTTTMFRLLVPDFNKDTVFRYLLRDTLTIFSVLSPALLQYNDNMQIFSIQWQDSRLFAQSFPSISCQTNILFLFKHSVTLPCQISTNVKMIFSGIDFLCYLSAE